MSGDRGIALIIAPDYASHFFPLSALAEEFSRRGMRVTLATGPAMRDRVLSLGFDYAELILGPGNNDVSRASRQPDDSEADHMREFFDATRRGPVDTLLYQSGAREHDMLWRPEAVYARLKELVANLQPAYIVVDQLAYGATLALHALQVPFASFVPANPASLPVEGEVFGFPGRLPHLLRHHDSDWSGLRDVCLRTDTAFTGRFNAVLHALAPTVTPVASAFRFTSRWLVLLNFPRALGTHRQQFLPSSARFIGACVRAEPIDLSFELEMAALSRSRPTVYVSLGTFLSVRADVLEQLAGALHRLDVNCVIATGSSDLSVPDPLPRGWVMRPVIPQIAALSHSDLAITHGGNNTITESLAAGVPLLVAPFSSDQFDGAADIESAGLGEAFDPNSIDERALARRIERTLADNALCDRVRRVAAELQAQPGPELAVDLCESTFPTLSPAR